MAEKVSFCIAVHNMERVLAETIGSCVSQDYRDIEIVVYDDCSTDGSYGVALREREKYKGIPIKVMRGDKNVGVGNAFNRAIGMADGDYIILMCADDIFTTRSYASDVVDTFKATADRNVGHVSRFYYQFIDGFPPFLAVREWATDDPVVQANNPSGLAFKREALMGKKLSNKMFVESSALVHDVLKARWSYVILPYHAVAVRVHNSTSTQSSYHKKYWSGSPLLAWMEISGWKESKMLRDFTSLLQIRTRYSYKCTFEEVMNFIKYRPRNLLHPSFWFFSLCALLIPSRLLRELPKFYRLRIGPMVTRPKFRPPIPFTVTVKGGKSA